MRPLNQTLSPGWIGALALCVLSACATARPPQAPSAPPASLPSRTKPAAYLTLAQIPRMVEVLPPAPLAGTARYQADREIFLATRALKGSPRWALATRDVKGSLEATLEDFSCALGLSLTPAQAPRLSALLTRLQIDAHQAGAGAKKAFRRLRPFQIDPGPVCQAEAELTHSFDYPSGHATWGWTAGLVLAQLAPERASEILLRARAYAESRVVCGAHNQSAIEAGATTAASLVNALNASAEFRADLTAARAELEGLRRTSPPVDAQRCAAERALIQSTPY